MTEAGGGSRTADGKERPLHIAICGCGPAGLAAALLLNRAGHRVCLFDQFESPRPVGSGLLLQPTGLAVLAELGLLSAISRLGARIERLFGRVTPSQRVVLDVRYGTIGAGWHALAVHRGALFGVLHDAVRATRIETVSGTRICGLDRSGTRPEVLGREGRRLGRFDLIVDALGVNSSLTASRVRRTTLPYGALWTTVTWPNGNAFRGDALEQRYQAARLMAGVLPTGRRSPDSPVEATLFWSLKRIDAEEWLERGIDAWKADAVSLWPETEALIGDIDACERFVYATYDHFTMERPWSERLVHIGDAAHMTSPQLGQGANMALLDALALARALQTNTTLTEALPLYARMRFWHVRMFQWASAVFTPFYQSDSRLLPFLRDRIAAPISRLPMADALLARLVSGMTAPPLGRHGRKGMAALLSAARGHQASAE